MKEGRFPYGHRFATYFTGPRRPALLAALIALSLLIPIWLGAHLWYRHRLLAEERALASAKLALYGSSLSAVIHHRLGLLNGLRAFVETHLSAPTLGIEFTTYVAGLHQGIKGLRTLSVAPGGIQRYVHPLAGNENVAGHDLLRDPRPDVRADVERTIRSRQIALSGPYELRQGGLGLVARLAVYQGKTFWGLVTMVLDLPPILEEAGLSTHTGGLDLALRAGSGQVFFGRGTLFQSEAVIHKVALPEGFWELGAVPGGGWDASVRQKLLLFDGAGWAIVLLLTALAYLVVNRDTALALTVAQRTQELVQINEQLVKDIAARKRVEEDLRKARDGLEARVQERTASLEKTNEALESEVAERGRAEREVRLLLTLTKAISESQGFHSALEVTLRKVCEATGWDFGEAWIPRPDGTALECSPAWYGTTKSLESFRALSKEFTFAPEVGLVGRVWVAKQPEWVRDFSVRPEHPRAEIARKAGLKAALGVPIMTSGQVLAVLVFFKSESREEDKELVEIVTVIANQLGSAIERKLTEQALQESEARLQAVMDSSTSVIFLKDAEGRYLSVNRQYEELFHITRDQIAGRTDYDLFPKEVAEKLRANDLEVLEAGTPLEFEESVPQDEDIHIYIANKFPLHDSSGTAYAVCGIATDITERKRMEDQEIAERRRAQSWLQRLIETTQDAVISIDRQGQIVLFNPAAERIFGYSRKEVQGKNVNILMPEPYASEHEGYIARYEKTREPRVIGRIRTVEGRRKSREVFPIELSVTEVAADEGVRYAAFIRDISEKTKLQESLIESERLAAIGATSAKLAHEIGNPLNGMSMTTQLLERRLARHEEILDDGVKSNVKNLMGEINRLSNLLHDFSSLSRREKYRLRPTSLSAVLAELLEMEVTPYRAQGIEVEQDVAKDLPLVLADSDKLKQALLNLCKNAVEAMPQGGKLTARAYTSGQQVVVELSDTGAGIPPEVDIFEPFTTTKSRGTGLGLVVVRQIVAAHGGTITYSSEPGRGTTFRLTLQAASS